MITAGETYKFLELIKTIQSDSTAKDIMEHSTVPKVMDLLEAQGWEKTH